MTIPCEIEQNKRDSTNSFNLQPSPTLRQKAKKITKMIVSVILIYRFCTCRKKNVKNNVKKNTTDI